MMLHTGNNTTTDKDDNTISRKQKVKTISTINTILIMIKLTTYTNSTWDFFQTIKAFQPWKTKEGEYFILRNDGQQVQHMRFNKNPLPKCQGKTNSII